MSDIFLIQTPTPSTSLVKFKGDTFTLSLELSQAIEGTAWVRTTLDKVRVVRQEIIDSVENDKPLQGRAWDDIPMHRIGQNKFEVTLGLADVGHFEAKCFFLKKNDPSPIWPKGRNILINVEPADLCCANIIYNAFVRQFGPNKSGGFKQHETSLKVIEDLDHRGYTVIPPSGTFRDLVKELNFIMGYLGCRILHLLPINPTPTTYGRMGRFGSPYAALDFTGIDPSLSVFDPKATPLEQFLELVDAVHSKNGKIILDIAPNHTGWAAELHESNPEWLVRDIDGRIQAPGAWGVIWEDLTRLDYKNKNLWKYMAGVFLTWCNRGVDGFRCDAGYMIPVSTWEYIVATVREQFPDTIFFLEGLGGKISVTRQILSAANFNWAYSELFQNYDRGQIEAYLPEVFSISEENGLMINFAETHDNNRLAATSESYARLRTALCALTSISGGFGFANGVEWLATEKIYVHDANSLNWGSEINLVEWLRRINLLLKTHPAFFDGTDVHMLQYGDGNFLAVHRQHNLTGTSLMILANLDMEKDIQARWVPPQAEEEHKNIPYYDLLTGHTVMVSHKKGHNSCHLPAGTIYCLTADYNDVASLTTDEHVANEMPKRIHHQCLRATVLEMVRHINRTIRLTPSGETPSLKCTVDMDQAPGMLSKDPEGFCKSILGQVHENHVVRWQWPNDHKRQVMIPPDHFLLIDSRFPFRGTIVFKDEAEEKTVDCFSSLKTDNQTFFALRPAPPVLTDILENHSNRSGHVKATLKLSVFESGQFIHKKATLIYLSKPDNMVVQQTFFRKDILNSPVRFLGTNGSNAMIRANSHWGKLESKYDALLAGNLNPDIPDTRRIMLVRLRGWVVFQGYSQDISIDCTSRFSFSYNSRCTWEFTIPCGQGQHVIFNVTAAITENKNRISLLFTRSQDTAENNILPDRLPVRLIIRPDIDDRTFHDNTKAYTGPEHHWPRAVNPIEKGFSFSPASDRSLIMTVSQGHFTFEPEWKYMEYLPGDSDRGLDPNTDLFSPGYFSSYLSGNEGVCFDAAISTPGLPADITECSLEDLHHLTGHPPPLDLRNAMMQALKHYIVKRSGNKSIIAGYPWFLDWGRDTLIVTRGLIAAGMIDESKAILKQFAEFEKNGTLPNIIHGFDTSNRDTSDAPLWFIAACKDLIKAEGNDAFLSETCGQRIISDVITSITASYADGTPNGIHMDPQSGLIFSPSHFTWMDTNFPAATPREGYPVEIQALWYHALILAAEIDSSQKIRSWKKLAGQVSRSIQDLFYMPDAGYLSDCLYASSGKPAREAEPDDARRPNQLFAVTMGAISDFALMEQILSATSVLVVPGAIRSLADAPVKKAMAVKHNNILLNDPYHPYQGIYAGSEDTHRKPAYHNGTAWTWVFPSYCEAWALTYGKRGKDTARALLGSSSLLINSGCAGQIPEICDGDAPHLQKGCDAQAWGVSEWLRVWEILAAL